MGKVALDQSTIINTTVNNHIQYRRWEYQYSVGNGSGGSTPVYGWNYYNTNATVEGKCNASPNNVFINGKNVVLNGGSTTENDTYSIPSGEYVSGAHTNATGSVTSGNPNNVFIGNSSVAITGSTVRTHASLNTTISGGESTNVFIGEG